MSTRGAQILDEVLSLPPQERAELVEQILASFQGQLDQEIRHKWAEEAESRLDAIHRGELETIPARHVFQNVKQTSES